jgi:DNA mismatch repair protein MutL
MAWQNAVKPGQSLTQKEMRTLTDDLFDCEIPNVTPNGKPCYLEFKKDELNKMFGR